MKRHIFLCLVFMVHESLVNGGVIDPIIPGCTGCSVKGICYLPNQEWKQGCWTKKCVVYPGGMGWRTDIVKTQCPDIYNRCIDHGQKASKGYCFCNVEGMHWSYLCA